MLENERGEGPIIFPRWLRFNIDLMAKRNTSNFVLRLLSVVKGSKDAHQGEGKEGNIEEEYSLGSTRASDDIVIGRSSTSDIILKDLSVSKKHGAFTFEYDTGYSIRDLGSKHGTLVNGRAISQDRVSVYDGDEIIFGRVKFLFCSKKDATTQYRPPAYQEHEYRARRTPYEAPIPNEIIPTFDHNALSFPSSGPKKKKNKGRKKRGEPPLSYETSGTSTMMRTNHQGCHNYYGPGNINNTQSHVSANITCPPTSNILTLDPLEKGASLLKKMGWKGEKLGKGNEGVKPNLPLTVEVRKDRCGLGSSAGEKRINNGEIGWVHGSTLFDTNKRIKQDFT